MTTTAPTFDRRPVPARVVLAALAIACGLAAVIYGTHATDRHGSDAEKVRACMEQKGPLRTMFRNDGRTAKIIPLDAPGTWGVMVCTVDGCEITSFVKEAARTVSDVIAYLIRAGYHC